ncbi:hypothetical protein [Persephonella sp.]
MKRFLKVGAVLGISALILTGCATKEYVDEQLAPVKEKVSSLEERVNALEKEIDALKKKTDLNAKDIETIKKEHADIKAMLERVNEKATDALNKARANEEAIRELEEKLKRQSVNLERVLKKGYRK